MGGGRARRASRRARALPLTLEKTRSTCAGVRPAPSSPQSRASLAKPRPSNSAPAGRPAPAPPCPNCVNARKAACSSPSCTGSQAAWRGAAPAARQRLTKQAHTAWPAFARRPWAAGCACAGSLQAPARSPRWPHAWQRVGIPSSCRSRVPAAACASSLCAGALHPPSSKDGAHQPPPQPTPGTHVTAHIKPPAGAKRSRYGRQPQGAPDEAHMDLVVAPLGRREHSGRLVLEGGARSRRASRRARAAQAGRRRALPAGPL